MSLKDDLLRNRRVFVRLTESESGADVPSAPPHKNVPFSQTFEDVYTAEPFSPPPDTREIQRQSLDTPHDVPQKTERYSLEFGRRINRETGMSLNPLPLEDVTFPELRGVGAPISPDPLESLYHKLEAEARRTSQLFSEEEY